MMQRLATLIMLALLATMLISCAAPRIEYIYEYKDVPVITYTPCDVEIPTKPPPASSLAVMVNDLIYYATMLELSLKYCTEEKRE